MQTGSASQTEAPPGASIRMTKRVDLLKGCIPPGLRLPWVGGHRRIIAEKALDDTTVVKRVGYGLEVCVQVSFSMREGEKWDPAGSEELRGIPMYTS